MGCNFHALILVLWHQYCAGIGSNSVSFLSKHSVFDVHLLWLLFLPFLSLLYILSILLLPSILLPFFSTFFTFSPAMSNLYIYMSSIYCINASCLHIPVLSTHSLSPLSLLQCDCRAPAGWFILCRLWVLGWRGGVEEVSLQSHLA